jgi:hypothetical protein
MLRIFKSNPLVSLVLPVLLAIVIWGSVYFIHAVLQVRTGIPMFEVFFGWLLGLPFVSLLFAFCLLVFEAYLWNLFINKQSLLKQSSYFTAMFYLLLFSCRPILISFYPPLLASLFLILAFRSLANSYKKEKALGDAFDAGIFIGIASLVYFPLTVFIVFLWIGLLTMRSLIWREWVVSLIGFILPFGFALAFYSVFYTPEHFWYEKLISPISEYHRPAPLVRQQVLLLAVVGVIAVVCLIYLLGRFSDNVVKNQKISALMIWFAAFSAASVILSPQKDARAFTPLILPLSFMMANYFARTKWKIIPELLFILLLGAIVINIFF